VISERLKVLSHIVGAKIQRPKSRLALADLQKKKLQAALDYATSTFSFYRRHRGNGFESLPLIDKEIYLRHFHELNLLGLSHEAAHRLAAENELAGKDERPSIGIQLGLSTGTSGSRGIFMTSSEERARWAGTIIERCLPGLWPRMRIAFFLRADNQLYRAAESGGRVQIRFFDLQRSLDASVDALNSYKPDLLIAPPYVLARLAARPELTIEPGSVTSVADVLDPWDEARIRRRFQVPLRQIYQATEGFLGATCGFGSLHLNEDLLLFERKFLDREKRRFAPVITDFHRRTQAIVRFELGDVLIPNEEPCPCGSPLARLTAIDGRRDEIFYADGRPVFRGEIAAALAALDPLPDDFRLVQTGRNDFDLMVPTASKTELPGVLQTRLAELGFERPRIHVREGLTLSLHEKRRRFVRALSQNQ